MALDFSEYFKKYEALLSQADSLFNKIEQDSKGLVKCGKGCSDCCYALFDLSLVEAAYLNHHFRKNFSGAELSRILERADQADREIYKIKRDIFRASQEGRDMMEIMREVAMQKVRCPLLGDDDLCELYEHRPLTCRVYGIPTAFGGQSHTCNRSGFKPGEKYPTVNIEKFQDMLIALSNEMARGLGSSYSDIGNVLVPASMALMNDYDEGYLNIKGDGPGKGAAKPPKTESGKQSEACSSCGQDESACAGCSENSFTMTIGKADDDKENE